MNNKTDTGGIAAGARLMLASLIRPSQRSGKSQKSLPTIACSETNDTTYHVIISSGGITDRHHSDATLRERDIVAAHKTHVYFDCVDLNY